MKKTKGNTMKNEMKKYWADIAPGYGHPHTASLTDGRHGCAIRALTMEEAIERLRARAIDEGWPVGEAMIYEIDGLGRRLEGAFQELCQRVAVGVDRRIQEASHNA